MKQFFESLKAHIEQHPPNYGDGESVLTMLYECHNENNPYDNEQIKEDFNELYREMNGMSLQEMDKIIYPVCKLCRDHERTGFAEEEGKMDLSTAQTSTVLKMWLLFCGKELDKIRIIVN